MKSIKLITFKLFLLGMIILNSNFLAYASLSKLKLKLQSRMKAAEKEEQIMELMKKLFSVNDCSANNNKKDGEDIDKDKPENGAMGAGMGWAIPKSKYNKYEKRLYGWGPSAYLFDFFDPVLEQPILKAFDKLWKEVNNPVIALNDKDKEDPYTLQKIFNMPDSSDEVLLARFLSLKPTFNQGIWKKSVTVPQLRQVVKEWSYNPASFDAAREIVDTYDYNGDGRLSAKEFIVAYLNINRAVLGTKDCAKDKDGKVIDPGCLHEVVKNIINPIFLRIDCGDFDDKIGAEEMWTAIRYLKRFKLDDNRAVTTEEDKRFDIFQCVIFGEPYHTTAVNDFVLKSQKTIDGYLNKLEFGRGIMLGYWSRSVGDNGIFDENKKPLVDHMKAKRWVDGQNLDSRCKLMNPK